MIAAFFKALLELVAELIRGEIAKDVKADDADEVPKTLRDRFRAKYRSLVRNDKSGVR